MTERGIKDQALEWRVRLEDAQPGEVKTFERWLAASPDHQRAFTDADQLWRRFDALGGPARPSMGRRQVLGLGAVGLAGLMGWRSVRNGFFADYQAGLGETTQYRLAGGGQMLLASRTAIDEDRDVLRLIRGRVWIDLTDAHSAPRLQVKDLGLDLRPRSRVDVNLLSDVVEVANLGPELLVRDGEQIIRLPSAQMLRIGDVTRLQPVSNDEVEGWRQDRLTFINRPLEEVVAELSRYRRGKIIVPSNGIAKIPVTLSVSAKRTDEVFDALERSLGVKVIGRSAPITVILEA